MMNIFASMYIVVDGYFVANFAGKTEFAAINLIMPVLNILGTIGYMFGVGGSSAAKRSGTAVLLLHGQATTSPSETL